MLIVFDPGAAVGAWLIDSRYHYSMTNLNPDQQVKIDAVGTLYAEVLERFRTDVNEDVRVDVRRAWLEFRDQFDFANPAEADAAAVGALLPVIAFLEEGTVEDVREVVLLMMMSLLDENVTR